MSSPIGEGCQLRKILSIDRRDVFPLGVEPTRFTGYPGSIRRTGRGNQHPQKKAGVAQLTQIVARLGSAPANSEGNRAFDSPMSPTPSFDPHFSPTGAHGRLRLRAAART